MPYTRKPIKINEMTKFTTKGAYEGGEVIKETYRFN